MIMLNDHPQSKPAIDLEAVFAPKRAAREAGILKRMEAEQAKGNAIDRIEAAMWWDANKAPMTTNLRQLAEIGIELPAPEDTSDGELPGLLRRIFDGLALWGTYFTRTNHLSDRELYERLMNNVLSEDVRDIPPSPEMIEFIDLNPPRDVKDVVWNDGGAADSRVPKVSDRDGSLPRPEMHRPR